MNEFAAMLAISGLAAGLTYVGAPLAERFDLPQRVISAALQFAAGIVTALVVVSLMPPAMRNGAYKLNILAFFVGGVLYVLLEESNKRAQARRAASRSDAAPSGGGGAIGGVSLGLFVGVLVDMFIDGAVVGIGSTLDLKTGLVLAIGLALSTAPLAFVTIATAKRQGMPSGQRRLLGLLFIAALMGGAILGYAVLKDAALSVRLMLVALASGFLITTVVQGIIPEANREGEPGFAGVLYIGGLSLYALMSLTLG